MRAISFPVCLAGILLGFLLLTSGCGPILYTANAMPASRSVEQARQAEAATRAPYEFYLAEAYLVKAREEAAQANYQDAMHFADLAEQNAVHATELSRRNMQESGR